MLSMKKIFGSLLAIVLLLGVAFPALSDAATTGSAHIKGQILVKFKDKANRQSVDSVLRSNGASVKQELQHIKVLVVSVPGGKEQRVVDALSKNPNVEFAELDAIGQVTGVSDEHFSKQYGLHNTGQQINTSGLGVNDADIDAPEAWDVTVGDGVKVAVLDTGVDTSHPDLGSKVIASQNFSNAPGLGDAYGHGTHVAGIIAAHTDNTLGVAGVCPGCEIVNGKVLNDDGYGAASWLANGITWSISQQARVINMSLGFRTGSKTIETAVNYAWNNGAVLVASAGNSGNKAKEYPAAYANVIAVAATDNKDQRAAFSTHGTWVSVAAPGENVYSTFPTHTFKIQDLSGRDNNYDFANGTSMSSPMAAGVAALVWSQVDSSATPYSVRYQLQTSADSISGTGSLWQWGRVNAYNAVQIPDDLPTEPSQTDSGSNGKGNNGRSKQSR